MNLLMSNMANMDRGYSSWYSLVTVRKDNFVTLFTEFGEGNYLLK